MFDYKLLDALAAVITHGSFEKAAQVLAITQSAVSQRIKLLEQRIGRPLLIRTSPVKPSPIGRQLLRHAQQVQSLESQLMETLSGEKTTQWQTVRLAVNADSLATWLPSVLKELFQHKILTELIADDQDVTTHYLKEGEVMGCISSSAQLIQGCRCDFLGEMEYIAVATPDFYRTFHEQPFSEIPTVHFGRQDELQNRFLKKYFQLEPGQFPAHVLPSVEAILNAAREGIAYGIVPRMQAHSYLISNELVEMTPGKSLNVPLYWHYWQLETAVLKKVRTALTAEAGKQLLQQEAPSV
ncbi:LysR family transcriptional regulator ArgP [Endozoicomonas arenosclerae]|uniref:LysR family transcriptional regulator ArgP n=1 Tax=Endozoicomonas arenosclerae TaxID=1633495 RepID=UPI000784CC46|nr:LysR family transcriptional regulator ArgP [Endozoicomonas arenosclerae]